MASIPVLIDEPKGTPSELSIVLAPGAGAGMDSSFMKDMARALAEESFRVIRFDFPYMRDRHGGGPRGRPDPGPVLEECWSEVVGQVGDPRNLVIGGRSMGGRIASMVADRLGVRGLVCMGYPFHPAGRPTTLRVAHLEDLRTPTLMLQGDRDALGSREEIAAYTLSSAIRIAYLPDGDHSFKPRKSSGHTYDEHFRTAVVETAKFCRGL